MEKLFSSSDTDVVSIFGPTGSGKTDVAVRVARALKTSVINVDPAQCYQGLPILTNKPNFEHDEIAPHKLIGIWPLSFDSSIAEFQKIVHFEIDSEIEKNGTAVICGGSGLYMQTALTDLATSHGGELPAHDLKRREELEAWYDTVGADVAYEALLQRDKKLASQVHPNDRQRVVRALIAAESGSSISPQGGSMWDAKHRHSSSIFCLQIEREVIRERVDKRTHKMFESGVLDEVRSILGDSGDLESENLSTTSRKLHGLSDCAKVISGEWNIARAIDEMSTRTKKYVKRQDTWARKWPRANYIPATSGDFDAIALQILQHL